MWFPHESAIQGCIGRGAQSGVSEAATKTVGVGLRLWVGLGMGRAGAGAGESQG